MDIRIDEGVEKFISSLEEQTIAKVLRTIDLLERFGYQLRLPHSEKVAKDLFELRVRGQQEMRIFYTLRANTAILLHGFVKKSQKIPVKELRHALQKLSTLNLT